LRLGGAATELPSAPRNHSHPLSLVYNSLRKAAHLAFAGSLSGCGGRKTGLLAGEASETRCLGVGCDSRRVSGTQNPRRVDVFLYRRIISGVVICSERVTENLIVSREPFAFGDEPEGMLNSLDVAE